MIKGLLTVAVILSGSITAGVNESVFRLIVAMSALAAISILREIANAVKK